MVDMVHSGQVKLSNLRMVNLSWATVSLDNSPDNLQMQRTSLANRPLLAMAPPSRPKTTMPITSTLIAPA